MSPKKRKSRSPDKRASDKAGTIATPKPMSNQKITGKLKQVMATADASVHADSQVNTK